MSKVKYNSVEPRTHLLPVLPPVGDGEPNRKWSFINVYSLKDLRDIYLITTETNKKSVKNIQKIFNEKLQPAPQWSQRKTLEYLNALVKLDFLDEEYNTIKDLFNKSILGSNLTHGEKDFFRSVFFEYFRFKEISAWFVNPNSNARQNLTKYVRNDFIFNSAPLFYCSESSRFVNTFFREFEKPKIKYSIEDETVMRFWDVFLAWGRTLEIIERFNISRFSRDQGQSHSMSIAYFIKPFESFDLTGFLRSNFSSSRIPIPEIILKAGEAFRYSVQDLHTFIVSKILTDPHLTFERTSEIFLIKGANSHKRIMSLTYLYPKIDNSFISHLVIRK